MKKRSVFLATAALVFLNLIVGAVFLTRAPKPPHPLDPALTEPRRAVAALHDVKTLFFTAGAKTVLQSQRPDLLADEHAFSRAAQNPSVFRQLDHRAHFDAALLCGDPAAWRPLLAHLLESRDWVLTDLDSAALLFRRAPAAAWSEDALAAEREKWTGAARVSFLTAVAGKLQAIGKPALAKSCLDEALALDGKSPEVWTQLSIYHGLIGRWPEALADVQRALSLDENFAPALATKAEILFGSKRYPEALECSRRRLAKTPDDPTALFLHAKIAHEAHEFAQETETLQRLVALAEKQGESASGYRIFLGQAYARDGKAEPALEEFRKAAEADDLTPEQRAFVRECMERVHARAALK